MMKTHSRKVAMAALVAVAAGSVAPLHHAFAIEAYLATTTTTLTDNRELNERRRDATLNLITGICVALLGSSAMIANVELGFVLAAGGTTSSFAASTELTRLSQAQRQAVLRMAKEDANAYIASGYQNPSALLSQIFQDVKDQMKELKGEEVANSISEEAITDVILDMA